MGKPNSNSPAHRRENQNGKIPNRRNAIRKTIVDVCFPNAQPHVHAVSPVILRPQSAPTGKARPNLDYPAAAPSRRSPDSNKARAPKSAAARKPIGRPIHDPRRPHPLPPPRQIPVILIAVFLHRPPPLLEVGMQVTVLAERRAPTSEAVRRLRRMTMIAITTNSSIKVKPAALPWRFRFFGGLFCTWPTSEAPLYTPRYSTSREIQALPPREASEPRKDGVRFRSAWPPCGSTPVRGLRGEAVEDWRAPSTRPSRDA